MWDFIQTIGINEVLNFIFGILAVSVGGAWLFSKNKLKQLIDALKTVSDAIEDDNVTNEEEKAIVAKFKVLIKK